ncbi:MAG: GNAT family N-acetyltransferase [bacterium]|nr:GNAT family N-acetyltransferase [bacterium]
MRTPIPTARLSLRPWKIEDWESLLQYANNRKVWLGLREIFPHPYTQKDAKWWVEHFGDDPRHFNFAIEFSREAIGGISLHLLEDVHQKTADIGYWLGEAFWGQGLATEAVTALTQWGFANLDLKRIQAGVYASNKASQRVMEKAGYEREALLKQAIFKAGEIQDEIIYAKFPD